MSSSTVKINIAVSNLQMVRVIEVDFSAGDLFWTMKFVEINNMQLHVYT
jgi:hypothetical protein